MLLFLLKRKNNDKKELALAATAKKLGKINHPHLQKTITYF